VACLAGLGLALALPAPAGAEALDAGTPTAAGSLTLAGATATGRTVLTIRGTLRVRDTSELVVLRCRDSRCLRRTRAGRATRTLRAGVRRLRLRLTFPAVPGLRVEVRHGGHLLAARRVLTPVRLAPARPPVPAPPSPTPGATATPPAPPPSVSIAAEPRLVPAYSPDVPDYVVQCSNTQPVTVSASVPAGAAAAVDGGAMPQGQMSHRDVPLQEGQAFGFSVTDNAGTRAHTVRCLPADFPAFNSSRTGAPDVQWLVFTPASGTPGSPYVVIADGFGVPVWWMRTGGVPFDATVLPDGTIAWAPGSNGYSSAGFEHYRLDGTPLGTLTTVGAGADQHELQQTANGNYLMEDYSPREHVDLSSAGGPADATVLDADIQELRPDGTLVWEWNSRDHIALAETASWGLENDGAGYNDLPAYDIVHINSIADDGDGIVFSARHLNAVYRIRKSDGAIDWKLGGTTRAESLAFVDDPLGGTSFGGQHDARVLPDGSLTVHDNGSRRGRAPRAVRYRLDTVARTATLVEQVTDSRAPGSTCCGSARRLSSGHWVVSWGFNSFISELDPAGNPVLTIAFTGTTFSYRAQPLEPGALDRATLHAGMDAMNPRP
jgi:hypothetical protein